MQQANNYPNMSEDSHNSFGVKYKKQAFHNEN